MATITNAPNNPAANNYGTNVVGIVAEQADYFTPRTFEPSVIDSLDKVKALAGIDRIKEGKLNPDWTGLYKNVIEFRPPYSLTPVKSFYPVERLKGNPSPDPSIPGQEMGGGNINFYLDPTSCGFWLKHLLQATTVTSLAFGKHPASPIAVTAIGVGADANSYGTPKTIGAKQPKDILSEITKGTSQPKPPEHMCAAPLELIASVAGTYRIRGEDHNGAPIEEELTLERDTGDGSKGKTTLRAYADEVTFSIKGTTAGSLAVQVDLSGVYEHILVPVSTVSEGLSLEIQEGNRNTPIVYNGTLISRGILRLEPVARFQAMVIANEALSRKSLQVDSSKNRLTNGVDIGNFDRLPFHAIPDCMMAWNIPSEDNPNVPTPFKGLYRVASMGLAIDNRIAPPVTKNAKLFRYPKPVRKANRELQSQVVIDHSKEADFDRFVGGLAFRSEFCAITKIYGQVLRGIYINFKQSQMISYPTRQVNGVGEMTQAIVTRTHIGTSGAGNDEVEIKVINEQASL